MYKQTNSSPVTGGRMRIEVCASSKKTVFTVFRRLVVENRVKVGVIGLGFMGTTHFNIHRQLGKSQIVAVSDVNESRLKGDWSSVVGNIGDSDYSKPVDMDGVKTYTDAMDLMLIRMLIWWIYVCLPFCMKNLQLLLLRRGSMCFVKNRLEEMFLRQDV